MDWEIEGLRDDSAILAVLDRDRVWAVYAICDLAPPYREHARYIGAYRGDAIEAVVLVYRLPNFTVMVPCGTASGVRVILDRVEDLPDTVSIQARPVDLAAVQTRYRCDDLVAMQRMVVSADDVRQSRAVPGVEIKRLEPQQVGELVAFYERLPGRRPSAATLLAIIEHGIYYGAFDGTGLLAVAGTHAISDRFGVVELLRFSGGFTTWSSTGVTW